MKLSDWRLIYELHKTPNMTRVAGILYITQSAVTKQLQHIEKELDTKIIHRTPSGLEFTEIGNYLAEQAEIFLKLEDETMRGLEALKEASPEKLVIGSAYTFSKYRLPEILDDFLEQRPSFRCQVINRQSNILHQMVLSGELDLAFVRSDYRDGVNRILVERTQGYIVTKGAADLADLPKMNRINYQSNVKTEDLIREWWEDRYGDVRPKEGMAVGYVDFALREVVRGKGYAICFLPPVTELDSKLVKTPLFMKDGNPVSRNTWLIWRMEKKTSPAMESFLRYIRKNCQISQ